MSRRSYRLSELIEALQGIMNAPVSSEMIKQGQAQVFLSIRDPENETKVIYMRGEIEIKDFGAYIEIGVLK